MYKKQIIVSPIVIDENMISCVHNVTIYEIVNEKKLILNKTRFIKEAFLAGLFFIGAFCFHVLEDKKEIDKYVRDIERMNEFYYKIPATNPSKSFRIYKELGEKEYRKYVKSTLANRSTILFFIFTSFLLPGIFFLFLSLPRTKKYIFDRENGTVTFPNFLYPVPCSEVFDKLKFVTAKSSHINTSISILHPNKVTRAIIDTTEPNKYLSLFVWYMDKNRPLPPGTAFDPYRQQDYERRKAEEFPLPLYSSDIDTPEIDGTVPDIYKGKKNNSNKI